MTGTAPDVLPDWLAHDSARTWREPGGSVTSGDSVGGPRVATPGVGDARPVVARGGDSRGVVARDADVRDARHAHARPADTVTEEGHPATDGPDPADDRDTWPEEIPESLRPPFTGSPLARLRAWRRRHLLRQERAEEFIAEAYSPSAGLPVAR